MGLARLGMGLNHLYIRWERLRGGVISGFRGHRGFGRSGEWIHPSPPSTGSTALLRAATAAGATAFGSLPSALGGARTTRSSGSHLGPLLGHELIKLSFLELLPEGAQSKP